MSLTRNVCLPRGLVLVPQPTSAVSTSSFYSSGPSAPSPAVSERRAPRIPRANSSPPALHPSQPASLDDSPQRGQHQYRESGATGAAARAVALPRAQSLPERQTVGGSALPTFSFGAGAGASGTGASGTSSLGSVSGSGSGAAVAAPRKRVLPWSVGRGGSKFRRGPHRGNRIAGPAVDPQRSNGASTTSPSARHGEARPGSGGGGAAVGSPPAAQVTRSAVLDLIVARSPVVDKDLMRDVAGMAQPYVHARISPPCCLCCPCCPHTPFSTACTNALSTQGKTPPGAASCRAWYRSCTRSS